MKKRVKKQVKPSVDVTAEVVRLRKQRLTYVEIGKRMGFSRARAQQIIRASGVEIDFDGRSLPRPPKVLTKKEIAAARAKREAARIAYNQRAEAWRQKRRAENLCYDCDNPPEPERVRCASCAAVRVEASSERFRELVAAGWCGKCGVRRLRLGTHGAPRKDGKHAKKVRMTTCEPCGEAIRIASLNYARAAAH